MVVPRYFTFETLSTDLRNSYIVMLISCYVPVFIFT